MANHLSSSKSSRYRQRKRVYETVNAELFPKFNCENPSIDVKLPTTSPVSVSENQTYNSNESLHFVQEDDNLNNIGFEPFIESFNSDDDDINLSHDDSLNLQTTLAIWAIRHGITHLALNDLLNRLSKFPSFSNLPKCSRTLLKTPTSTIVKNISGGVYHHFGITKEIEQLFDVQKTLPSTLLLMVGIDGLPITNNPPSQFWPILGYFINITDKRPNVFIIGVYYGKLKPTNSNEYLSDFVDEVKTLINVGLTFNQFNVKILLHGLICDAPAKSFVLQVKGHTGKNSCVRCKSIGVWTDHRVYFSDLNAPLRSHNDFIYYSDSEFHIGKTILTEIPEFNLVSSIPYDYMHCICIGIMKKLLLLWTGVPKTNNALPANLITAVNNNLINLSKHIPEEFQRTPNENNRKHPLYDASRWKAVELRQCLLYTGMVIFKDVLSKDLYDHFLQLVISIRILSTENISEEYINYASNLLK